jgi:hypothetical protein
MARGSFGLLQANYLNCTRSLERRASLQAADGGGFVAREYSPERYFGRIGRGYYRSNNSQYVSLAVHQAERGSGITLKIHSYLEQWTGNSVESR